MTLQQARDELNARGYSSQGLMAQDLEKAPTPHERETQLADDYLTGAQLAREVSHYALRQALEDAKAGTLRDPAKTAMNAAITSGTLLDKRLLLQERPTQIVRGEDPKQAAQALARRLGVTLETTAHDIETPALEPSTTPTAPLPAESQPAKRAHARVVADRSRLGSGRVHPAD